MSDFKVSTEITTKDSSSGAIRKATRELKAYRSAFASFAAGELKRGGVDAASAWDKVKSSASAAVTSVTSVGGAARLAFGVSKLAASGFFSVAKVGLFGSAGLLAGLGLAARAVHGLVDEFVEAGDEVSATATKLGIGVEALQELRYAADFSDLTIEEFDSGVAKLNVNLGKAKRHTGALYTELRKSKSGRVLLEQLLGAGSTDEAVAMIVEAGKRIPDVTKRADFMKTALGGAGQAWLKFGDLGADGLRRLREEAQASGSVLSEEQTDMAGKVDDANKRLSYSWRGLKMQIASELAPSVLDLTQKLRGYLDANRGLIAERVVDVIRGTVAALKDAYTATRDWLENGGWDSIKNTATTIWTTLKDIVSTVRSAIEAVGGLRGAFELLTGAAVIGSLTRLASSVGAVAAARAGAAAVAQAEALNAIGLTTDVKAAEAAARSSATAGLGWFGPLAATAYAGAKGYAYLADAMGPQDTAAGVDSQGRQLYTRSGGALDSVVGALTGLGAPARPETTQDVARRYVAQEIARPDSGSRAYGQLLDRGVALDDLRALTQALRARGERSYFDAPGRLQADKRIDEIIVRFDGLPPGARPEVQGKGPAQVKAAVGRRGLGGIFGGAP